MPPPHLSPETVTLKKLLIFNGRIIAFQYCFGYYHTSVWISHRYTYAPSFLNPLPSPSHASKLLQSPGLSSVSHITNYPQDVCFEFRELIEASEPLQLEKPGKQLGRLRIWTLWSWVRPEIETLHFLQALGILVVHEFHLEFWWVPGWRKVEPGSMQPGIWFVFSSQGASSLYAQKHRHTPADTHTPGDTRKHVLVHTQLCTDSHCTWPHQAGWLHTPSQSWSSSCHASCSSWAQDWSWSLFWVWQSSFHKWEIWVP